MSDKCYVTRTGESGLAGGVPPLTSAWWEAADVALRGGYGTWCSVG